MFLLIRDNEKCNILRKHFEGNINLNHKILSNVAKINIKTARRKKRNLQSLRDSE